MLSNRRLEVAAVILILAGAAIATAVYLDGGPSGTSTTYCGIYCTTQGDSTTTTTATSTTSSSHSTTQTTGTPSTTTTTTTTTGLTSSSTSTSRSTTYTSPTTTTTTGPAGMRLGFWLQEADVIACTWQGGYQECGSANPAQLFFNSMFMTPPYPSTLEVMIFAVLQAQTNHQGCSSSSSYISSSEAFWGNLATLADPYPNIRLVYEIAFNSTSTVYGLSCFQAMASYFGHYPSVYGIGIEGEYSPGVTAAQVQQAMSTVSSEGKAFINYYVSSSLIPSGGFDIRHTNFPGGDAGGYDQVGTLSLADPQTIGIDSGYYYPFPFPGTATCPIGSTAMDTATAGWNQCVVETEINVALQQPTGTRQFVELDVAFSSSGSFTGVSGLKATQLWDNPTLRNWIWTNSNYTANFILSK